MKKLFGRKKNKQDKVDTKEALQAINEQMSMIEEKQQSLMARIKSYEKQAKELYRNKEQRTAVLKMKQSKMLQKELNKVEGMQILLMQQKMGLEGTAVDTKVLEALKKGNLALKEVQKQAGIQQFEEMAETMQVDSDMEEQEEVQEFFREYANEGAEDIEDELRALIEEQDEEEAEKAKKEKLKHEGAGDLPAAGDKAVKLLPQVRAPLAGIPAKSDDELLEDLMA